MRRLSSFSFLLGFVLLFLLLRMVDLHAAWHVLESAQPFWVITAFIFLLPEIILKSFRIATMARVFHSPLSVKNAVWIYLSGQPLSAVTPAKLGDIIRVLGISRWGELRPHSAFAVHAADKIYDLLALVLLASTGLITLIARNENQAPAVAALLGIFFGILLMALFLNPQWMRSIIKPLLLFLAPRRLADQLHAHGREFYKDLLNLFQPSKKMLLPFTFSIAAWIVVIIRAYLCALALAIPITFTQIALLLPVVIVIEFIPITILGFGTREWSLFLFFSSTLVTKPALLSFSFLLILAGPLCTALIGIPCAMRLGHSVAENHDDSL